MLHLRHFSTVKELRVLNIEKIIVVPDVDPYAHIFCTLLYQTTWSSDKQYLFQLTIYSKCPIEITEIMPFADKKYGSFTKGEAKRAGYWPSSFFACYGPRQSRGP